MARHKKAKTHAAHKARATGHHPKKAVSHKVRAGTHHPVRVAKPHKAATTKPKKINVDAKLKSQGRAIDRELKMARGANVKVKF